MLISVADMLIRHCDACGKEVEGSGYYRLDVSNNGTNDNYPRHIVLDLCSECYNIALDVLSYRSPALSSNIDRVAGRPTTLEKIFKEDKPGTHVESKPGIDVKIGISNER